MTPRLARVKDARASFGKWVHRLGLGWWGVDVYYCRSKKEIKVGFGKKYQKAMMRVFCDWRYAKANIYVNVPRLQRERADDVDMMVIHELCHILVHEMREGEMHHEERVVTGLTKAILWVDKYAREE